jgi:hypothetical protein
LVETVVRAVRVRVWPGSCQGVNEPEQHGTIRVLLRSDHGLDFFARKARLQPVAHAACDQHVDAVERMHGVRRAVVERGFLWQLEQVRLATRPCSTSKTQKFRQRPACSVISRRFGLVTVIFIR